MSLAALFLPLPSALAATYEWTFNGGDLSPTIGRGVLSHRDAATSVLTTFGTTDGSTVPHINGQPAAYLHVPAFTGGSNGYALTLTQSGPNGGGIFINQYTIIMDLFSPGAANWQALWNTDTSNGNDADFYIAYDGTVGIGALGYSPLNTFSQAQWHRLAFTADFALSAVNYYLDGVRVFGATNLPGNGLDGRFSLSSNTNAGPDLILFNEGDLSGVYTHELVVNSVLVADRALSSAEIAALGGPRAQGIGIAPLTIVRSGQGVAVTWEGAPDLRLQRATQVGPADWSDVAGTLGASGHTEPAPGTNAFFRLVR